MTGHFKQNDNSSIQSVSSIRTPTAVALEPESYAEENIPDSDSELTDADYDDDELLCEEGEMAAAAHNDGSGGHRYFADNN